MPHRETNPHFTRPLQPPPGDRHRHPPPPSPPSSSAAPPPPHPLFIPSEEPPRHVRINEPTDMPRVTPTFPAPPKQDKPRKTKPTPPPVAAPQKHDTPHKTRPPPPAPPLAPAPPKKEKPRKQKLVIPTPAPSPEHEQHVPRQHTPPPPPPPRRPHSSPRHHDRRGRRYGGLRVPDQKKTKPHTWLFAIFCLIFWLVIIIGGLIVLIVYLVFRPQSPHFDVSSASLNAAYLDLGYLLNADVTLLANFTNPNKKVHVDFSTTMIYLYYGSTLIATQYVEPFSTSRAESRFATIHMVSSQVQLPLAETQRLVRQVQSNGILLEVKGVFRARSTLGRILRYSYNLYGYCTIMLTRPPGGVLIKRRCITKR